VSKQNYQVASFILILTPPGTSTQRQEDDLIPLIIIFIIKTITKLEDLVGHRVVRVIFEYVFHLSRC